MQIKENLKEYDVIIVGSGAGGGMATKILSEAGLSIAIVEAGPYFDPANPDQMTQMKWAYDSPRRGRGTTRPFGDFDQAYGGWDIEGEPYSQVGETQFRWFRSRMLGGRTNHWGRISLRFGPDDFRKKSIDGLGEDWPITYDDIKPYYDKVDKLIGVFGKQESTVNSSCSYSFLSSYIIFLICSVWFCFKHKMAICLSSISLFVNSPNNSGILLAISLSCSDMSLEFKTIKSTSYPLFISELLDSVLKYLLIN